MLLVPVYLILLFPLVVVSFSPSVFLFRCMLHLLPLPLSSCLGCIPPLIGLPSLRFYAVASSLFLLSVFLFMFSILSRRCPLLATSFSVLFCLLSMLISDSRFDLVWFRLSCDHGWIRSGSINARKQQHNNGKVGRIFKLAACNAILGIEPTDDSKISCFAISRVFMHCVRLFPDPRFLLFVLQNIVSYKNKIKCG